MSKNYISLEIDDPTAISMDDATKLKDILVDVLKDYSKSGLAPKEWSKAYFKSQLPEKSDEEITEMADEIDSTISSIENKRKSVMEAHKNGIGTDDWFVKDIQSTIGQISSREAANYAGELDAAV